MAKKAPKKAAKLAPAPAVTFNHHSFVPEFSSSLDWYFWNFPAQTIGQHKSEMEDWADGLDNVNTRSDSTLSKEDAESIGIPADEVGKEVEELIDDLSDHLGQLDHFIETLRGEGIEDPESLTAGQVRTAKIQQCYCEAMQGIWKKTDKDYLAVLKATVAWIGAEASWKDIKTAIDGAGLKSWKWAAFDVAPLQAKATKFRKGLRETLGEYNHIMPHNAGPHIGQALTFGGSAIIGGG